MRESAQKNRICWRKR